MTNIDNLIQYISKHIKEPISPSELLGMLLAVKTFDTEGKEIIGICYDMLDGSDWKDCPEEYKYDEGFAAKPNTNSIYKFDWDDID